MIASGDHTQKQTTLYLGELITRTIKKIQKNFAFIIIFPTCFFIIYLLDHLLWGFNVSNQRERDKNKGKQSKLRSIKLENAALCKER